MLISLDENFDPHLAQAENLAALFIALKDEVFEIRELAVCIIGRLCSINPAHVMPFLRKMLIEVCKPQRHYIIHVHTSFLFNRPVALLRWCSFFSEVHWWIFQCVFLEIPFPLQ